MHGQVLEHFRSVILLSLYWKHYTRNGAIGSMLSGALTVIIWKQLEGGIFNLYEIVPGFVNALIPWCRFLD